MENHGAVGTHPSDGLNYESALEWINDPVELEVRNLVEKISEIDATSDINLSRQQHQGCDYHTDDLLGLEVLNGHQHDNFRCSYEDKIDKIDILITNNAEAEQGKLCHYMPSEMQIPNSLTSAISEFTPPMETFCVPDDLTTLKSDSMGSHQFSSDTILGLDIPCMSEQNLSDTSCDIAQHQPHMKNLFHDLDYKCSSDFGSQLGSLNMAQQGDYSFEATMDIIERQEALQASQQCSCKTSFETIFTTDTQSIQHHGDYSCFQDAVCTAIEDDRMKVLQTEKNKCSESQMANNHSDPKDDLLSLLAIIGDQIKMLAKQLADVTNNKLRLIVQLDQMTAEELRLQSLLYDEQRKEIAIKEKLTLPVCDEGSKAFQSGKLDLDSLSDVAVKATPSDGDLEGSTVAEQTVCAGKPMLLIPPKEFLLMPPKELLPVLAQPVQPKVLVDQPRMLLSPPPRIRKKRQPRKQLPTAGLVPSETSSPNNKSPSTLPQRSNALLKCVQCPKQFATSANLARHTRSHGDATGKRGLTDSVGKSFRCGVCDKSFARCYALTRHTRLHAGDARHLCSACGKGFVDSVYLRQHMEGHTRVHRCDVCARRFSRLKDLTVHRRKHTGENPYMCAKCGRVFKSYNGLQYHRTTHDVIKSHVCLVCDRRFPHASNLRTHMRRHGDARLFGCAQCGEHFLNSYGLKLHLANTHPGVGETPYACMQCEKKFVVLGSLKSHLRSHTIGTPHKCNCCEKQYRKAQDLRKHRMKAHSAASALSV